MHTKKTSLKESDVFISYGRAESKIFASKLYNFLTENNLEVWFDQNDIPLAVDFQNQIDEGILKAKHFIFIIAPHSLKSDYCLKEINLAIKYNKPIIPILHIEPQSKEIWDKMHPVISKLNWIYCRQNFEQGVPLEKLKSIDDIEKNFNSINEIIKNNSEYKTLHRDLLIKAVEWDRNQRNKEFLLSGVQMADSEKWIKIEFKDQQPPCLPTDLHCEYICESKELIHQNQTDAFLSYNPNNIDIVKKVYIKLIRKAYTVWAKDFDIELGDNIESVSKNAIEKASNFIIFLTKETLQSKENITELNYAIKLNKRIIPIKIDAETEQNLPEEIQKLYFLNFNNKNEEELEKEYGKILNFIEKNYYDFNLHKEILVKALIWGKNNSEIKYLLRGFDLEKALEWFDNSNIRKEYTPTALQSKFIDESKKSRITAFISYARNPSKDFATIINNKLTEKNYDIWFDQNNIPLAVDFQEQINKGIEKSDNFIFIISSNSIKSEYCKIELELALKYNKRIIPILHELPEDINKMHPTISKLNWIYFRDNVDNFDKSLAGLESVLESYSTYVKQHTVLLSKAIKWTKHQFNEKFLLERQDFVEANNWLLTKFENEQAPCFPCSLHCDFIMKSKKFANNNMTDIFFCYDEQDYEFRNKIYYTLAKEGFTAADNKDFNTDIDFLKANHEAIEKADNFVFLISPQSVKTEYCIEEISHALIFNKRIILVMIEQTNTTELFEELQNLSYIDFTDSAKFDVHKDKLIAEIEKDKSYFYYHKLFLLYSFEWKKQNSNTALLLSGYELEKAKLWLTEGENREINYPTPLHTQFINKSLEFEINTEKDVYISYSEFDFDLANRLNFKFKTSGKSTWFDRMNIPANHNIIDELISGIENSNNCLFIISESALKSNNLKVEIQKALDLNKKIIALLLDKCDKSSLPKELSNCNIIEYNNKNSDFSLLFNELIRIIDVDRDYILIQNKWQKRANEWSNANKTNDLLLRGTELQIADEWLREAIRTKKNPQPSVVIKDFLTASYNQKNKEHLREKRIENIKRLMTFVMGFLFLISAGLGIVANYQRKISKKLLIKSNIQRLELLAEDISNTNPTKALAIAQFAVKQDSLDSSIDLLNDIYEANIFYKDIFVSENQISSFVFSDINNLFAITTGNEVYIYNQKFELQNQLVGHEQLINNVDFSKDAKHLLTSSDDGFVILWDINGKIIKNFNCNSGAVLSVKYSPDENYFLTACSDNTAKLWDFDGNLIKTFTGHKNPVWNVAFSPDGSKILTGSFDYTARLWGINGKLLQTFEGHTDIILSVDFSANGKNILTSSDDNTAIIWNLDGSIKKVLEIPSCKINNAGFSPSGNKIITANNNNTITLWDLNGNILTTLYGHTKNVYLAQMSFDEKILFSCSEDKTLKKWYINGIQDKFIESQNQIKTLCKINDSIILINDTKTLIKYNVNAEISENYNINSSLINCIAVSADKKYILTGDCDNNVYLTDIDGNIIKKLTVHQDIILDVEFTPDCKNFFTVSQDYIINYWDIEGNMINTFESSSSVLDIEVSPDGKNFITSHEDKTIIIWDITGKVIQTIRGHLGMVNCITISPDGKYFASGSYDNLIKIWDFAGNIISTINFHTDVITDLNFSENSKFLISASKDKLCCLLNLNGNCLNTYYGHKDAIVSADFIDNYNKFISASKDGEIKIWTVKPDFDVFINNSDIEELSISEMIEYRIIEDDDVYKISDLSTIIEISEFFTNKALEALDFAVKLEYQNKAVNILEKYYSENPDNIDIKIILSKNINTLSYYQILNKNYSEALTSVKEALTLNENLNEAISNLAMAYLLNNKLEEAKRIYTKFMKENYDEQMTYGQIFLADLMNIEQNGIYNPNFEEIYFLLY